MDFPLTALMDEDACYAKLVAALHPGGLACPRWGEADRLGVHRRHRASVLDYPDGRHSTTVDSRSGGTSARVCRLCPRCPCQERSETGS